MKEAAKLSYCAEEVRRADPDRFLVGLFAPREQREDIFSLYAFNLEIAKTREMVSENMLGAIRLQWWREAIEAIYAEDNLRKHAIVEALSDTVCRHNLSRRYFDRLIDGRMIDFEPSRLATMSDLIEYADATSGSLVVLTMEVLGGSIDDKTAEVGRKIGVVWALTGLMRSMPSFLRRGRLVLPNELIDAHGIEQRSALDLKPSRALASAVAEIGAFARKELHEARAKRLGVSKVFRPALLLGVLAESYLGRLDRAKYNVFEPIVGAPAG
ncbi:MAG: hypothetical protein CFH10_00165, partial [Alphaproteobacteria bacterium MarineAlpha4_Bin2]